ncbi:MAG: NADH-quinone oxidoreductase subunit N [Thermoflavifilum sp.]|nr:NADH-quinone oxidoreductase subunit N [Thermoflavifilum sp.]MCL6513205.1 NADH-quinone oxidoreductase subunit N [Alicyclobacillus sp.]
MPDLIHAHYFVTMGPLLIVTATAFIVMVLEFCLPRVDARVWLGLSILGTLAAVVTAAVHAGQRALTLNSVVQDAFSAVFSLVILGTTLLILWFALDFARREPQAPKEHPYLILFAVAGALTMASAVDLVTLYVGLELLSVASYVLVGVRRQSARSTEGAVKYLLMGSIGSAVLLYGMSFIYGLTGSTNLYDLGQQGMMLWTNYPAVTVLAFLLMLCGMGFKLSLVPFHAWTPDTYAGAPGPVSALLATLSKTAGFALLLRMLLFIFNGAPQVYVWAGVISAATMVVGNLAALPQRHMKRMLAFSSVAQAGYLLVPFALFGASGYQDWIALFDSLVFYLVAYTFMTVGAFAVIWWVSRQTRSFDASVLDGLARRNPWLAGALTVFLLGLAGMPLTAGFVGKLYLLIDTVHLHEVWLGVLLFLTSAVSFYYYFGWIRRMFQPAVSDAELAGTVLAADAGVFTFGLQFDNPPITPHPGDEHWQDDVEGVRVSAAPDETGASDQQVGDGSAGTDARPGIVLQTLIAVCVIGTLVLGVAPAVLLHGLWAVGWYQ